MALCLPSVAAFAGEISPEQRHGSRVIRHVTEKKSGKTQSLAIADVVAEVPVMKKRQAPSLTLDNGVQLYGWLGYIDVEEPAGTVEPEGLYEFSPAGYSMKWSAPDFVGISEGWEVQTSWLNEDGTRICGYSTDNCYGYQQGAAYVEYDFLSGELKVKKEYDIETNPIFNVAALNTADGYIYGFGFDSEGNPLWKRANSATPTEFETVRQFQAGDQLLCSMAYCPTDGMMYAVTASGKFVSYDSGFNMTEIIGSVGVSGLKTFVTGLCYSDKDNLFYWNVNTNNPDDPTNNTYKSYIYSIDVAKKSLTKVMEMYRSEEFMSLYVPVSKVDGDTPVSPEYVSSGFAGGALSGNLSFRMPSCTGDDTPISTEMEWKATVDGVEVASGKASASQVVNVPYSNLAEGNHQFGFSALLDGKASKAALVILYIGNDKPIAPANVRIAADKVSWDAVTEGVNKGYVDSAALSYEVSINGKNVGTFTTTSADIQVADMNAPYAAYRAAVVAVCNGKRSETAQSPKLFAGKPFELDMEIRPTAGQAELCIMLDGNNDGSGWVLYDEQDDSFFNSQYSMNGDADDYIVLPAIDLPDKEAYYEVSMDACSRKCQQFPEEYIDVRIGRTPEISAMTQVIIEKTKCTDGFKKIKGLFKVSESGTWYVAVRCCSAFDQYGVFVKNIKVSRSEVTNESPTAPAEIVCTPGANGELTAKVEFTMPKLRMNGTPIPASTKLVGVVSSKNTVTVTGTPGEKVSVVVETSQGNNKVKVAANDDKLAGLPAETEVYTGVVIPGFARNVKADVQEDNITIDLKWDAPLEGENGGFIRPEDVHYEIYLYGPGGWSKLALLGNEDRSYRYVADDLSGSGMAIVQLGVRCINVAGANPMVSIGTAIIGTPFDIPFEESFDHTGTAGYSGPDYGPSMMLAPDGYYTAKWGYSRLSEMTSAWAGMSGGALVCEPDDSTSKGRIALPKVSTNVNDGDYVAFVLRAYTGKDCADAVRVYADSYGMDEPVLLGEIRNSGSQEWTEKRFNLPASLVNRAWIQPMLDVSFTGKNQLFILDWYKLFGTPDSSVEETVFGDSSIKVAGMQGEIVVSGADGLPVSVYAASGSLIAVSKASRIAVPAGIYVVKIAGKVVKAVVR